MAEPFVQSNRASTSKTLNAAAVRALLEMLEGRTLLSVGDLNLSFGGGDGMLRFADPVSGATAFNVVPQPDGKIIAGGASSKTVWLERFDAKGNIDKTFGTNGIAKLNINGATDFVRQSDGKFIVVTANGDAGAIVRFTSAGKIDTSFGGGDGIVTTTAPLSHVVILPNGKIAADNSTQILEFNADGSPNNSFAAHGVFNAKAAYPAYPVFFLGKLAAQKDNKVIVSGTVNKLNDLGMAIDGSDPAIVRVTTAGKPDTTFDHDGLLEVGLGDGDFRDGINVALQSNGNMILAARDDDDRGYLFGFKPDGEVLPGFKQNTLGFSNGTDDDFGGVAIYGADNLVFFGASPDPDTAQPPHDFDILGFTPAGVQNFNKVIDFSWTDDAHSDDVPVAAAMTSDGNIIVAGNDQNAPLQVELASLQGKPGGPSDKIPITITNSQVTITGTTKADTINLFGGSNSGQLFIDYNGNRAVINNIGLRTLLVNAGDGNDHIHNFSDVRSTLNGQNNDDVLIGGPNNDFLGGGSGNDILNGGLGADTFAGGAGNDTADYSARTANLNISIDDNANDGAANEHDDVLGDVETILGGSGNDTISANSFANLLKGNAGNDVLFGSKGNDTLDGGAGNDKLFGQDDNDTLLAKDGQVDSLDGGTGFDQAQRDNTASIKDQVLNIEAFI